MQSVDSRFGAHAQPSSSFTDYASATNAGASTSAPVRSRRRTADRHGYDPGRRSSSVANGATSCGITVGELAALPHLGMSVLAGHAGLGRRVSSAQVVDARRPWDWLDPGALVLTTGWIIPAEASSQAEFIERSNVDPTTELTELMKTQRLLEANAQMIRYQDQTLGKLIEVGKI